MPDIQETIIVSQTASSGYSQVQVKIYNSELVEFCEEHKLDTVSSIPYYVLGDIRMHVQDYKDKTFLHKTALFRLYTILNTNKFLICEYLKALDKKDQDSNLHDKANRESTFLLLLTKREFLEAKIEEKEKQNAEELQSSGSLVFVDDLEEAFK